MTPKPLVDITLPEIIEEILNDNTVVSVTVDTVPVVDMEATIKLKTKAIIKAIKERVPEKKLPDVIDPDEKEEADKTAFNSAIDQLNQNLWGK